MKSRTLLAYLPEQIAWYLIALLVPVGVYAGERAHEQRFAMVDVTGGGDDHRPGQVNVFSTPGSGQPTCPLNSVMHLPGRKASRR